MEGIVPFESLFSEPSRNGLTKPKAVRGAGTKIVNMGELFAYPRMTNTPADKAPLSPKEKNLYLLKSGDLLFARQSLVPEGAGKCSIFIGDNENVTFESHLIRIRLAPNKACPMFYYYYFRSPIGRAVIESIVEQGAGVAGIRASDLSRLDVDYIPIKEQEHIADILGSLDDKIELNRKMNETLEAMTRAIFKSWFVDFDPVVAKSEGQQPENMDAETAKLFPDSFEDSEIGRIPKGWRVFGLDGIADYLNGLALQKYPAEGDESLPIIKIAQLRTGSTDGADLASTSVPAAYIVQDGDVLFSWSGSLTVVLWCGGVGALNQHLFKVTSKHYPKWFFYLWTQRHLPEFQSIAADKATTMGHIQRHHLSAAKVVVPPPKLLDAIGQQIAPLVDASISHRIECRNLAAIRDALLPRLLSGELSVSTPLGA